jgi:four helix bundle protein
MTQQELEDRLLVFNANVVQITKRMPRIPFSIHLIDQVTRSSSAPALMYGEACAAESRQDFIHKMGIGLKELRETRMSIKVIRINQLAVGSDVDRLIDESEQLIRIFGKSINTARRNRLKPHIT